MNLSFLGKAGKWLGKFIWSHKSEVASIAVDIAKKKIEDKKAK
jgi:hypothetical protein